MSAKLAHAKKPANVTLRKVSRARWLPVFVAVRLHGDRACFDGHFTTPNPCPQAHTMRSGATGTPSSASCIDQLQIALRAHRIITARFSALFSFLCPSWAIRRFVFCFISSISR
jgi:hypothetical protein